MARVTVEDCIEKIPNRFDLVLTAGQRARGILKGDLPTIDRDNDKNPVVALREIADETILVPDLEEELIQGLQRHADSDDPEEEAADLLAMEEELTASAEADAFTGDPAPLVEEAPQVEEAPEEEEVAEEKPDD